MAKIRKKPKPADQEKSGSQVVVVPEPVQPPPPAEYKPPVQPQSLLGCMDVRTPEDVIHNVMMRQIRDDLDNPPPPENEHPALALLKKVQDARDAGQSLEPFKEEAAKILQGVEQEEKFTLLVMRVLNLRKLRRQLETSEALDKFLHRIAKRGDLTSREALIFKQLNVNEIAKTAKELVDRLEQPGAAEAFASMDFAKMDYSLTVTDKTVSKEFAGTTPQGREIIRKITMQARRKIYGANIAK